MEIRKGDRFLMTPESLTDYDNRENGKQKPVKGTAVYVNAAHGFALLDFGFFRECFSFYGKGGLMQAQRVGGPNV